MTDYHLQRYIGKRLSSIVDGNTADYRTTRQETLDREEQRLVRAAQRGRSLLARLGPHERVQLKAYCDWRIKLTRREFGYGYVGADDYVEFSVPHTRVHVLTRDYPHSYFSVSQQAEGHIFSGNVPVVGPRWLQYLDEFRDLQVVLAKRDVRYDDQNQMLGLSMLNVAVA